MKVYTVKAQPWPDTRVTIETTDPERAVEVMEALSPAPDLTPEDITGPMLLQAEQVIGMAHELQPDEIEHWLAGLLKELRNDE